MYYSNKVNTPQQKALSSILSLPGLSSPLNTNTKTSTPSIMSMLGIPAPKTGGAAGNTLNLSKFNLGPSSGVTPVKPLAPTAFSTPKPQTPSYTPPKTTQPAAPVNTAQRTAYMAPQSYTPQPTYTPRTVEQPKPSVNFEGILLDLVKKAQQSSKQVERARENLQKFKENVADTKANIYSDDTSARVMQGRDAQVQAANASKLEALQGSLSSAIEEQGQQFSALQGAGALAAPTAVPFSSVLYDPISGQQRAGGFDQYAQYRSAEDVMGLASAYPDAGFVYNSALTPQQNLATFQQQYLPRSATYQKQTYGVPGVQNLAGAAISQTAQGGYGSAQQELQSMQANVNNAKAQSQLLRGVLNKSFINETDLRPLNTVLRTVGKNLSSEQRQELEATLEATKTAYSNLLIVGGGRTPSEAETAVGKLLDGSLSANAIIAGLNKMEEEALARLRVQQQLSNQYLQTLQGGGQTSGGLYDW